MFRVIRGDVLGEPGAETVAVFGDCAEQTRPVSLASIGESGSGKSTLLEATLGLIAESLHGRTARNDPPTRHGDGSPIRHHRGVPAEPSGSSEWMRFPGQVLGGDVSLQAVTTAALRLRFGVRQGTDREVFPPRRTTDAVSGRPGVRSGSGHGFSKPASDRGLGSGG
jgi:energy-coupling factor transporter ATP-binding protein EcfA2